MTTTKRPWRRRSSGRRRRRLSDVRRQVPYVVGIIAISVAGLVYTFASGNEPLLGLDGRGIRRARTRPLPNGQEITEETLDQAVDIIEIVSMVSASVSW